MRALLLAVLGLGLASCATIGTVVAAAVSEGAEANSCREPGPHDAAGPGRTVCESPDGTESTRPADRAD